MVKTMKTFKNIFSAFHSGNYFLVTVFLCAEMIIISSCNKKDPNSPGLEFMPDMYRSPSLETNSPNAHYADSMTNRNPVEGTIPRGFMPYSYPNTPEGYEAAGRELKDPFSATPEIEEEGKVIYSKYCVHCHGATGQGDGSVAGKLPGPPPSYSEKLKDLPEGKMYHVLEYGKGLMGSHASQMTQDERWKVIRYVQRLQKPAGMVAVADSNVVATDSKEEN